jgi:hypothetical protein
MMLTPAMAAVTGAYLPSVLFMRRRWGGPLDG